MVRLKYQGLSPGRSCCLFPWARHFVLTVPLSNGYWQNAGVTLQWTSIPFQSLTAIEANWDELQLSAFMGHVM